MTKQCFKCGGKLFVEYEEFYRCRVADFDMENGGVVVGEDNGDVFGRTVRNIFCGDCREHWDSVSLFLRAQREFAKPPELMEILYTCASCGGFGVLLQRSGGGIECETCGGNHVDWVRLFVRPDRKHLIMAALRLADRLHHSADINDVSIVNIVKELKDVFTRTEGGNG